jgi:Cellulase (glycosyl hydrolase family 5)
MAIGLNAYPENGNTGEQGRVLTAGVSIVRTDRDDYGLSWAHAHGLKVDGIIWMNASSVGAGADLVELDNEPYYNNWDNLGGVEQWAQKARDVAKQVRAAHPSATILLPSLAVTNNGDVLDNGTWTPMLNAINKAAPDIWQYVDGIAIHPYTPGASPSGVSTNLSHLRSELAAIGGRAASLPFYITEVGWTNTGDIAVSESTAATYMQQLISSMAARGDVSALIAYCASDNPNLSPASEQGYGVFRADGTAKPILSVLQGH